jgi:hypothetical protein
MLNGELTKVLKNNQDTFPLTRKDIIHWMRESVESLITRFAEKCGKWRWAEKTPAHVFHMALMHEMFPKARFIHMIRDGRAVVRSLQQMSWAPRKLRWSIKRWKTSVEAGRKAAQSLPPGYYVEVHYEELVANPRGVAERLCDFIGEPYSPRMLEFHLPENNSWGLEKRALQNGPIIQHPNLGILQRLVFNLAVSNSLLRELGYD